ncbi:putative ph domain-containing protein [Erysiphe neolycopersici]|uniref:Putative ph domain-containing protein n=1 Tax=Erysiphe neolycopersici TaxID=212602 RepID=A0A420I874_9PEZI|nr:putative ph domain-containing protein [Erysiphe neolycopersici]
MYLTDLSPQYENLPRRFQAIRVQPREDEGREKLPAYSTTISLNTVLERKMEFQNAIQRASNRNWHRVRVTLQGTALNLYKPSNSIFGLRRIGQSNVSPLLRSYNLHHAQVGVATDYVKKKHVIRIRVETEQFLLSCDNLETLVNWIQTLATAIDLATPLDDRDYPEDFYLPRRHRRSRTSPWPSRVEAERNVVSSLHIHSRARALASSTHRRSRSSMRSSIRSEEDQPTLNFNLCPTNLTAVITPSSGKLILCHFYTLVLIHIVCTDEISNFTQNSKWRPSHHWSPSYDMIYAKRCLAVLTSCMPRKSNTVIVNGEFYLVDWVTGHMSKLNDVMPTYQSCENFISDSMKTNLDSKNPVGLPPEYGDVEKT